ncbi:AAA family ATPase [Pseudomonas syringae]|uniref:AAA family ATPase n=1 Tax=Pseudomonas syringae TaxID=317 RepID=UPI0034D555FA
MHEHMHSFGVRNLRSFGEESPAIPIKPINIFVGKNSCGKSTFLRTFPLLRQSIQVDTKTPILWFGSLVDFGDFDTALHDAGGKSISFEFNAVLEVVKAEDSWDWEFEVESVKREDHLEDRFFDTKVTISISRSSPALLKTKLLFEVGSSCVELTYSGNDISNAVVYNKSCGVVQNFALKIITTHGSLIPTGMHGLREMKGKTGSGFVPKRFSLTRPLMTDSNQSLTNFFINYHHASKSRQKIREGVEELQLASKDTVLEKIRTIFAKDRFFVKNLDLHKDHIKEVAFTFLMAREFTSFLKSADGLFKSFFSGVRYQAPLRAAGERFYRYQDLRVDEVDHTGSNLPMVINSLDNSRQKQLSAWILASFGFELSLSATGLHYELRVREEGDKNFHNISDMGFGYSQILPVIVSIWLEFVANLKRSQFPASRPKGPRVIVLEQPELHLHPALQYKFGLAIAKVISQAKRLDLYFIIETHSKHLIDAIGESVRHDVIDEEIVNIAIFEKPESGVTTTTISGFDSEGYLVNWPIGFLSPDYDN